MKLACKFTLLITLFILGNILCYAQTDKISKPVKFEDDSKTWKEFSNSEGKFSILFPETPNQSTQLIDLAPNVQIKLYIHNIISAAEYSVMYADYPIPTDNPTIAQNILDFGAEGAVASLKSELLEKKEIELDGNPGRYLKEKLKSGQILRAKMILAGQRLYQVAITTPNETEATKEDIKLYETVSDKFLNSFKLLKDIEKASGLIQNL